MDNLQTDDLILMTAEVELTAADVVSFIRAQHETIRLLFEAVLDVEGEDRERVFYQLRRLLAVHETAEEQIVHPVARRTLVEGDAIIAERLAEEHDAKQALAALEKIDPHSRAFEAGLRALQDDVMRHATAEENQELDELELELDDAQLMRLRRLFLLAEAVAPTRPHPGVESALANTLVGPFATIVDRVRDLVAGKR
jgi:hemerythrin superfamily protein